MENTRKDAQLSDLIALLGWRGKKGEKGIFYRKQEDLAVFFTDLTPRTAQGSPSRSLEGPDISNVKRGKDSFTVRSIDEVFDRLFAKRSDGIEDTDENMLSWLHSYFEKEGLQFPGWEGKDGDSYESYVKRFLTYVFTPSPVKNNNSIKVVSTGHVTPQNAGKLRSQNFPEKKCFFGRESTLAEMEEHLYDDHIVVLSGLGGIGKSYLSEEYAIRHEQDYDLRQQIKFSSDNQVHSFRELIMRLKFDELNEKELSDNERYEMRLERLEKAGTRALLLLDSVDTRWDSVNGLDGVNELSDFICNAGNSCPHIIITTRLTAEFDGLFPVIKIEPLAEEEQFKLFERHLGYPVDKSDREEVKGLFQYVGGHTLLIELCAKSIREGELDYAEMKECLMGKGDIEQPDIIFQKDGKHQTTISNYVRNILFKLDLSDDEKGVLRQAALLPAEGISRKLFFRELCPSSMNPLVTLERKGWIETPVRDKERLTRLHPVIREVVKQTLDPDYDNCKSFFENLLGCFAKYANGNSFGSAFERDLCRLCRSLADSDVFNIPAEGKIDFLRRMVTFYQDEREYDYRTIAKLNELQLALLEASSPTPAGSCVETCLEIGMAYQQLGKYEDAIRFFLKAEPYAHENRALLCQVYQKLGDVSRKASEYPQAREYFKQALVFVESDHDRALVKNAFGVLCINEGKSAEREGHDEEAFSLYEEALSLYEEAKQLWESYLGQSGDKLPNPLRKGRLEKHLAYVTHNIGTAWHNIGKAQKDMDRLLKAKKGHEEGKQIRENHDFDGRDRDLTASYAWLGNDLMELAKLEREEGHEDKFSEYMQQAKEYIDRSFADRKGIVGENHQDFAWPLKNLSDWYETMGDIPSALAQMEKVVDIRMTALGERHEYTKDAIARRDSLKEMIKGSEQI